MWWITSIKLLVLTRALTFLRHSAPPPEPFRANWWNWEINNWSPIVISSQNICFSSVPLSRRKFPAKETQIDSERRCQDCSGTESVCVLACEVSEREREREREWESEGTRSERARARRRQSWTHLCWLVIVLMYLVCLFPLAALYRPIREALTLCHHRTENRPLLNQLISPRMQILSAPSQTHSI